MVYFSDSLQNHLLECFFQLSGLLAVHDGKSSTSSSQSKEHHSKIWAMVNIISKCKNIQSTFQLADTIGSVPLIRKKNLIGLSPIIWWN